ncbi:hypothetical protein HYZ80_02745 [Candidatus Parcubacteria bacterium]|nr:hypothetical protein [Candidatus Parcubacteria bacterium]
MAKDTWGAWGRPAVVQAASNSAANPSRLTARPWFIFSVVIGVILYVGGCSIGLFLAIRAAQG